MLFELAIFQLAIRAVSAGIYLYRTIASLMLFSFSVLFQRKPGHDYPLSSAWKRRLRISGRQAPVDADDWFKCRNYGAIDILLSSTPLVAIAGHSIQGKRVLSRDMPRKYGSRTHRSGYGFDSGV